MREAIKWGLQVNKRTVRMIKLERLWKCGDWEGGDAGSEAGKGGQRREERPS